MLRVCGQSGRVLAIVLTVALGSLLSGCKPMDDGLGAAGPARIEPGTSFGQPGDGPGQFGRPRAIAATGAGDLVVIDRTGRVQVLDARSGNCIAWFTLQQIQKGFPTNIRVWPSPKDPTKEAIWIADTHNHRVLVLDMPPFDRSGQVPAQTIPAPAELLTFGTFGTGDGQFVYPCDVLVTTAPDPSNLKQDRISRIYVAEFGDNDRVSIFEPQAAFAKDGAIRFVKAFGRDEKALGGYALSRPQTILNTVINGKEQLVVLDSVNHRIGIFSMEGALARWIEGGQDRPFAHPRFAADLGDETILITEFASSVVRRVDLVSGQTLGVWGGPGREAGKLAEPWGIVATGAERGSAGGLPAGGGFGISRGRRAKSSDVFVVDAGNHRIVRMNTKGLPDASSKRQLDRRQAE